MHCWKMTFRDLNIRIWQHLLSHTKIYYTILLLVLNFSLY